LNPEVSVVLVTYNRAKFLPRTLDGILNQTFSNFELLICDDCSPDQTQAVCEEYAKRDSRIQYIRNPVNLGMPGNLNSGLKRARCELIANLHDGDIYYPALLEKWRDTLLKYPSAAFVFNIYRHLAPDGISGIFTNTFKPLISGREFLEDICFVDRELECPVWGTVMGRKSVYESLGYFDPSYSFWADFDMWFRIAESYDIAFVPELLIDLPSRAIMPHLFTHGAVTAHRMMFRAYWNARLRHYRGRPLKLTAQLGKQIFDFGYSRTRRVSKRLKG
jgi:glycosyltransferase involved in cell wall biosynthesis